MVEAGDYEPAKWSRGHDFGEARRSYASKKEERVRNATASSDALLENRVETQCENPLVIACDVTGSMGDWPEIIFGKLPYLEHEAKEYLGDDVEICFAGIGDAISGDRYPLQIRPFAKEKDLLKRMQELMIEKGGGSGLHESYELAAAYFANNCDMPNAINPVLIFIGDEKPYDTLAKDHAKRHAKVDIPKQQTKEELYASLKQQFEVYFLQKVNGSRGNKLISRDQEIYDYWEPLVGADHIVFLPEPDRVVDCIFGILGEATGKRDYFIDELKHRQLKDADGDSKVRTVMTAMKTIHVDRVTEDLTKKKKSKKLL